VIERYSLKEMSEIWKPESRFHFMLTVEKTIAQVQGDLGIIPKKSAKAIFQKAKFSYSHLLKREKITKHDVTAFIDETARHLGQDGAYFHYGLTSSDVLDTALSLQIKESASVLFKKIKTLKQTLKGLVQKHKTDICLGRTHGMPAELTTFGFKILGHLAELVRAEASFKKTVEMCAIGKLSGAVGNYASLSPQVEKRVCKKLSLQPETLATQVIPRDRLARLIFSLALIGAFIERLAIELRHLQRAELGEVLESFSKGQTGSSAMPHKKNPISSENLTGISRLLRSYVLPTLENISLWHERDISHSSVERVILPDAFILSHYALDRLNNVLKSLKVNKDKMRSNLEYSQGRIYSSQVLNFLVKKGLSRSKAYPLIQKISQSLKKGEHLKRTLKNQPELKKYLSSKDLDTIFSGKKGLHAMLGHLEKTLKQI